MRKEGNMLLTKEYILCAAIHYKDGQTYNHQPKNIQKGYVVCGRRHHNCFITRAILQGFENHLDNTQGFLTNTDRFVTREEAYVIAIKSNQFKKKKSAIGNMLFSEDLW
jgi:hypothetical protein